MLLFSNTSYSQIKKQTASSAALLKKIDSLEIVMHNMQKTLTQRDTLLIKVDKLSESFKSKDSNWYEKILPSIFAFLTVIVSSVVAYWIGIRNIRVQETNTERQANTQLSIAADNLYMSKEQLDQNTKNTLAQIRSNNISKARIEWIQNLRPLLSDFFANISKSSIVLKDALDAKKKGEKDEVKKHMTAFQEVIYQMEAQNNQIDLFLNPSKASHKDLEVAIVELLSKLNPNENLEVPDSNAQVNTVIEKSRIVLKEAWEKAKSETTI